MLCQFLLYNEVNQLYVYLYPLPLGPPSHPHHPTYLGGHRAPSCTPRAIQQFPTSYLFYTWQCIYVKLNLPVCPTLPFPCCVHISALHLRLCSCPTNSFICTIFLDFTYIHQYMIFVFLFLAYFTLYDRCQVHPHLYK